MNPSKPAGPARPATPADPASAARPSIAESIRALSSAQKAKAGAPLYSRLVNRPLGRVLAAIAHRLGATPDQVTILSAACTMTGVVLIAALPLTVWAALATAGLLVLGYALDSADGQLARLRHGGSKAGEWLDHVADAIKLSSLHLAIAISLFRFAGVVEERPALLLLPLAYSAVQNVHFFSYILTYQLRYNGGTPLAKDEGRAGLLKSILSAPTDYGLLCIVLALRWAPVPFLVLYALMLLGSAGYLALALPKWYRDMRAL